MIGPVGDLHAELIALIALGVLALAMRWAFRRPRTARVRPVDAAQSTELGLLQVVAAGLPRAEAMRRRAVLGDAGIRSSMSLRRDGAMDVLVFHGDVETARSLLEG